jgi:cold shock CspA family protein
MTGRVTRLIDHRQTGIIAAEDGHEYVFRSLAITHGRFDDLSLGMTVRFEPITGPNGARRAGAVQVLTK